MSPQASGIGTRRHADGPSRAAGQVGQGLPHPKHGRLWRRGAEPSPSPALQKIEKTKAKIEATETELRVTAKNVAVQQKEVPPPRWPRTGKG